MHASSSIKSVLQSATLQLNTPEAKLEAQYLLQHVLQVNRAWLIAHENEALQASSHAAFEALLTRRMQGEPVAYILGYREFYGLTLKVSPDTLIPRADTETLVEAALNKLVSFTTKNPTILDLGTGSGAIALAVAKNFPIAFVTAVDASKGALNIAQQNAQKLEISNIQFILSDWFGELNDKKFDLIVSNPPYIENADAHLRQGDLRFEPISALASGVDGLDDIRQIIGECLIYLKPQGWIMLEHGYNQAQAVTDLMASIGLTHIESIKDLGGHQRVTIGKNPLIVSTHWSA
ncbi:MAG TPA: peptide chain release factor N(5)-glutamine methyltransferase [Methylotenera sp.]|nr:peptide chain release factor N(5)-glutamine methyltransferase [Methylotenera sp.]HPH05462.1 peptide chain release factor N(5)-glutamine methyltransferase [Methylotenera sp.]HPN01401.1 peptide chain release factor N(5)-glutamine methyltransferase [Methylotenera sp.]